MERALTNTRNIIFKRNLDESRIVEWRKVSTPNTKTIYNIPLNLHNDTVMYVYAEHIEFSFVVCSFSFIFVCFGGRSSSFFFALLEFCPYRCVCCCCSWNISVFVPCLFFLCSSSLFFLSHALLVSTVCYLLIRDLS